MMSGSLAPAGIAVPVGVFLYRNFFTSRSTKRSFDSSFFVSQKLKLASFFIRHAVVAFGDSIFDLLGLGFASRCLPSKFLSLSQKLLLPSLQL